MMPKINDLIVLFQKCYEIMNLPFELYGAILTWWDVFMWSSFALIFGALIWRFLNE